MDRYHRQTILPGFGSTAAARLAKAHVMIVGCGALGCPAADLLARAGVGRLTLVDRDVVELTNLQRQSLYDESDAKARRPKAEAAARRLVAVNSEILIEPIVEDCDAECAPRLFASHPPPDVVLDCTDNFETRYLLNDACVQAGIPLVYGGAVGTTGMNFVAFPAAKIGTKGDGPCLRCVFSEPPAPGDVPTCDTAGILGPVATFVAAWQAADALRLLVLGAAGVERTLCAIDLWTGAKREIDLRKARLPDCPCCGKRQFDSLQGWSGGPRRTVRREVATRVLCGRNAVQVSPSVTADLDLSMLASRLTDAGLGSFDANSSSLQGILQIDAGQFPLTVFPDGRAIVGGTTDPVLAKVLYARFVGA